jgi:thiamine-monophosphate kinase
MAEADLIKTLISRARRYQDGQTLIGPGDDAALIAGIPNGLVISTDSYLEGSHYQRAWLEPEELAQRCLGAALSDLAAMGALPRFYTLALTLAGDEDAGFIDSFGLGLGMMSERHKIDLIGGDLTRGMTQGICMTVMGTPTNGRVMQRRGARAGDGLWVSGSLGGSAAGLALLQERGKDHSDLSLTFRLPQPRILLGSALARMSIASAGIDISDGFLLDLSRLCKASGCGARIDRSALPYDPRVKRIASLLNHKAESFVLQGGEDYELLFSVHPAMEEAIGDLSVATSTPLARVGMITDSGRIEDQAGQRLEPKGWDPFLES